MEEINLAHAAFAQAIRDVQDAASRLHRDRDRIDERVSGYLGSGWTGIAADSCRNPGLRKSIARVGRLVRRGMTTTQVMRAVGQPFRRLGNEFGVCATAPGKPRVMVTISFTPKGRVTGVRS